LIFYPRASCSSCIRWLGRAWFDWTGH